MNPADCLIIGMGITGVVSLLGSGAFADAAARKFRARRGFREAFLEAFLPSGAVAIIPLVAGLSLLYLAWALAIGLP